MSPQIIPSMLYIHFQDEVSWVRGKHSFKFGGEFSALLINTGFGGVQIYNFANNTGGPIDSRVTPFIGSGFAAMLLGDVTSASIQELDPTYWRRKNFDLFADDSWKASQRLTVELGLRWDANTPYHDALGQWQEFNPHVDQSRAARGEVIQERGSSPPAAVRVSRRTNDLYGVRSPLRRGISSEK